MISFGQSQSTSQALGNQPSASAAQSAAWSKVFRDFIFQEQDSQYFREGILKLQRVGDKPRYPLSGFFIFAEEIKRALKAEGKPARSQAATKMIKERWLECPRQQDYHRLSSQHYQDYRRLVKYWKQLQPADFANNSSSEQTASRKPAQPKQARPQLGKRKRLPSSRKVEKQNKNCKRARQPRVANQCRGHLWISLPGPCSIAKNQSLQEAGSSGDQSLSSDQNAGISASDFGGRAFAEIPPSASFAREYYGQKQNELALPADQYRVFDDFLHQESIDKRLLQLFLKSSCRPQPSGPRITNRRGSLRANSGAASRDHIPGIRGSHTSSIDQQSNLSSIFTIFSASAILNSTFIDGRLRMNLPLPEAEPR